MLQALTFDFWGTLYQNVDGREERLHLLDQVLARHSQPRSWTALEAAYRHGWSMMSRIWRKECRTVTVEHWLREVLAFLDAALPEDVQAGLRHPLEEVHLHSNPPLPVPGVAEVVPRLAQRFRLGLISDVGLTPGRVLRELMRRDGLLCHFQALTFSDETGATKPLPGQFLRTLAALQARPQEAAHIGDLPETDLAGARGVGMLAILFLGISQRQDGRSLADAAFDEYGELEEILEGLV